MRAARREFRNPRPGMQVSRTMAGCNVAVDVGNTGIGARALPVAEEVLRELAGLLRVDIPHDGDLADRSPVEVRVELPDVFECRRLDLGQLLLRSGHVTHVPLRIGVQMPPVRGARDLLRLALALFALRERLLLQRLEFRGGKDRLAQALRGE